MVTDLSEEQFLKAHLPISFTDEGMVMVTLVRQEQPWKA